MSDECLLKFTSHIHGKNALVRIYPDRVEWTRPRGISGAKLTAGILTAGVSMVATGVKNGKSGTEMIPVSSIASVATKRDGILNTVVSVITSGNTIDFRVSHNEAEKVRDVLTQLIRDFNSGHSAPVTPSLQAVPPSDLGGTLAQLAALRDAGVLTEQEFVAKKAEILGRM